VGAREVVLMPILSYSKLSATSIINNIGGQISKATFKLSIFSPSNGMLPTIAFTDTAADKTFPSVIVPAGFLPSGITLQAVYPILKFRGIVNSLGSINAIAAANKSLRIKLATGAWGVDDIIAMIFANSAWSVAGTEGPGDILISTIDVKALITGDDVTVNFGCDETNSGDAVKVTGASLTLKDVECGLLYVYSI